MKTVDELLKKSYHQSDDTKVSLQLEVPLGFLREHHQALGRMIVGGKIDMSQSAAAPASTAARGKQAQPKKATKAAPESKSRPQGKKAPNNRVTLNAVMEAIKENNQTPEEIANAIKANRRQVGKALSRYTKTGRVVRVAPGRYALPA
jgi:predicted Rossmann fold nucleotide-binding protein DprA/Smf involved in DNA uptake